MQLSIFFSAEFLLFQKQINLEKVSNKITVYGRWRWEFQQCNQAKNLSIVHWKTFIFLARNLSFYLVQSNYTIICEWKCIYVSCIIWNNVNLKNYKHGLTSYVIPCINLYIYLYGLFFSHFECKRNGVSHMYLYGKSTINSTNGGRNSMFNIRFFIEMKVT